jgi:hypothetical protein
MNTQPSVYQSRILLALNQTGKHIYGGTVTAKEKARRRAANKVARMSRRANRGQR